VKDEEFRLLAGFRALLREFQSFSEHAAQENGLTSLQYQTLLAIKAQADPAPITITALAQMLMIKHNSAVGLVDRIEQLGLVIRCHPESDRRSVVVRLTARGDLMVAVLAKRHRQELQRMAGALATHARRFAAPIVDAR
jgi:DNA-binding MarR family transcriptional regulator